IAGSRVAGSWTSPRTGVPTPWYLAGFLVMATTSWPARSKATHNRWPTKPDAPATSTFTGPPRALRGRACLRGRARPSRNPDLRRLPPSWGPYTRLRPSLEFHVTAGCHAERRPECAGEVGLVGKAGLDRRFC